MRRAQFAGELARLAGLTAEARADVTLPTWDGVVEVADGMGAATIEIGSRGLAGVREFLSGSLSHQVAEHADRPVLIVSPAPRQGEASVVVVSLLAHRLDRRGGRDPAGDVELRARADARTFSGGLARGQELAPGAGHLGAFITPNDPKPLRTVQAAS